MSDGQFSSKPMRSERARDSAWRADGFTNDPALLTDAGRAFMQSRLLQRELNALSDQQMPTVGRLNCAPLPRTAPAGVGELGTPLASAVLVQE